MLRVTLIYWRSGCLIRILTDSIHQLAQLIINLSLRSIFCYSFKSQKYLSIFCEPEKNNQSILCVCISFLLLLYRNQKPLLFWLFNYIKSFIPLEVSSLSSQLITRPSFHWHNTQIYHPILGPHTSILRWENLSSWFSFLFLIVAVVVLINENIVSTDDLRKKKNKNIIYSIYAACRSSALTLRVARSSWFSVLFF